MAAKKIYTMSIKALLCFDVRADSPEEAIMLAERAVANPGWSWDELGSKFTSAYVTLYDEREIPAVNDVFEPPPSLEDEVSR